MFISGLSGADKKLSFLLPGIKVTLEEMTNNGLIIAVTDAGTKQEKLEKEIKILSKKKNIKIFFVFAPSCRAKCDNSLPVYKRLSDGRMFKLAEWFQPDVQKLVAAALQPVCNKFATIGDYGMGQ